MKFGCNAIETDGWYGITLFAAQSDTDVLCYRSVFKGERGRNTKELISLYTDSHIDTMKTIGASPGMSEEKIAESVEMTAQKMGQWGLNPIDFSDVPDWILFFLFADPSDEVLH
jgi:hypothetical protein